MTGRGGRGGRGERPFCIELSDIRPRGGREGVAEHEADEQHADTSRADQQRVAGRPLKGLPLRRCNGSHQILSTPPLPEHSVDKGTFTHQLVGSRVRARRLRRPSIDFSPAHGGISVMK